MSSTINLGLFSIHYYSLILLFAFFVGWKVIENEAKRQAVSSEFITNLLFWTLIVSIIGARIYFVLFNFDYYSADPIEIFKVWHGGLAIHGGIIFGLIFILFYCYKYKENSFKILDMVVVGLIIAQAIGRWGNFFNMEAHGPEVSLEYLQSLYVPDFIINGMYINGVYYLPTFYFESLLCLFGFVILLIVRRFKKIKIGQITALYLIFYGIIRYFIESFRTDSLMLFDFKIAQIVSVIMLVSGFIIFIISHIKKENLYN